MLSITAWSRQDRKRDSNIARRKFVVCRRDPGQGLTPQQTAPLGASFPLCNHEIQIASVEALQQVAAQSNLEFDRGLRKILEASVQQLGQMDADEMLRDSKP